MGTNKRYGIDLPPEAKNDSAVRPKPISLTKDEAGSHVREATEPLEVTAWVRFPETPIEVVGKAIAWTDRAVLVEFRMFSGAVHQAWVWASAVRRR